MALRRDASLGARQDSVFHRTRNLITFRLERLLLRGMHMRLLLIAASLGVISLLGGALVLVDGSFDDPLRAIWWAFLRLTDPGYLGDDNGVVQRTVSTGLTVLGYVLFMGALVAIMTQWLNERIRNLEGGFTPLAQNGHVLILGWTSRTPTIVREMLQSEGRVRRFLRRREARRLHLVLLTQEVSIERRYELQDRVGDVYRDRAVALRSGTPLRLEHLERVDFMNASAILLPSDDISPAGAAAADTRTIMTLLSMSKHGARTGDALPMVVTELLDANKVQVATRAYAGRIEIVKSDLLIGFMLAQAVLHEGLADLFRILLMSSTGNAVHIYDGDQFVGQRYDHAAAHFSSAVMLGIARPDGKSFAPELCPAASRRLEYGERLVMVARTHTDALPGEPYEVLDATCANTKPPQARRGGQRLLVLGWSNHVPPVLSELAEQTSSDIDVDVVSVVPVGERAHADGLSVKHIEADPTSPTMLGRLDMARYHKVLLVASDLVDSPEDTDARTVVTHLLLREQLDALPASERPRVVVELESDANATLFDACDVDVLVTPLMVGQILAHVPLRPELRCVYEALLGVKGPELGSYTAAEYGLDAQRATWTAVERAAASYGHVVLALLTRDAAGANVLELNPEKTRRFAIESDSRLIVLKPG